MNQIDTDRIIIHEGHNQGTVIARGDQHIYVVNHELELLIRKLKKRQIELHLEEQQVKIVRILLVDDSPALRAGIRFALENSGKFSIVAETGTVKQALKLLEQTIPDIVVASLCLPDASGAVIAQKNIERGSHTSVILLGSTDVDVCLVEAWQAGATGFLSKQMDIKHLVQMLEMASCGQHIWTSTQLKQIERWRNNIGRSIEMLSCREREVLCLLSARMTNREIAQTLSLSEKTIEHYVSEVLGKLGAISRTEVAQWAEQAFAKRSCPHVITNYTTIVERYKERVKEV